MNGTAAVRQLLVAYAPLTALVPATRIVTGANAQGTTLPAIAITEVSGVDRNIPNPGANRHVRERVQITVMAANYPAVVAILKQARRAAADQMPTVAGISNVVVHTDGQGPYFTDEAAAIHMKTQDFRVTYNEAR